jgi:hypothetical protein
MPLSDSERQRLEELEQTLYRDEADEVRPRRRGHSRRLILLGILVVAAGLALLVASIPLKSVLLGILAFVLMVLGIVLVTMPGQSTRADTPAAGAAPKSGAGGAGSSSGGFADHMRRRWERKD